MSLRNIASALLMLAAGQVVHGVIYRTIQLNAGLNATLPCHELDEVGDLRMWVTPSRGFIGADFNPDYDKYAIDGTTGSLEVKNTRKADSGSYLCITQPNGPGSEYKNVSVTLNVLDVSYLPEVDDWEANLIRGIIAAVCTAALFIGACGLHHFSWHNRHEKSKAETCPEERRSSTRSSKRSIGAVDRATNGVDNPALSIDAKEADSGL